MAVYEERYDEVLAILDAGIEMGSDAIFHMDHDEKSAEDYVREYITRKEYLEIENPVEKVIEVMKQKKGFLSSLFKKGDNMLLANKINKIKIKIDQT